MPSAGGTPVPRLTPAHPRQMLADAIQYVTSLPMDAAERADSFEAMFRQIEGDTGGAWQATRGTGTDGSVVFLGRQGEGLVVATDGRVFRGVLGRGIDVTPAGLQPNFNSLVMLG
jgi:hypothetical protein